MPQLTFSSRYIFSGRVRSLPPLKHPRWAHRVRTLRCFMPRSSWLWGQPSICFDICCVPTKVFDKRRNMNICSGTAVHHTIISYIHYDSRNYHTTVVTIILLLYEVYLFLSFFLCFLFVCLFRLVYIISPSIEQQQPHACRQSVPPLSSTENRWSCCL